MLTEELYKLYLKHPTITTDSRTCTPGSIFFALHGDSFDGNVYASQAIARGCAYAVIDRPEFAPKGDSRYIKVTDALRTLQDLAHLHRQRMGLTVLQITGTNGKTTTKELVAAVLARKYRVLHTEGNYNNHIGVPLTLLRLTPAHEIAVVETGANHRGEIALLTSIAAPNYGIVTNVGRAHLEGFGSFQGVVKTKAELYEYLRATEGRTFINADSPVLQGAAQGIEAVSYGTLAARHPDIEGKVVNCQPMLTFAWKTPDGPWHTVDTQLIGDYNIHNLLAAVAVGRKFRVDDDDICRALADYSPAMGRSQLMQTARNTLIVDAYNANPTSMHAALQNFAALQAANKMVILGEMRELGTESENEHLNLLNAVRRAGFAKVWLIGEAFEKLHPEFPTFHNAHEALAQLQQNPLQGYTILIKGSNSNQLYLLAQEQAL